VPIDSLLDFNKKATRLREIKPLASPSHTVNTFSDRTYSRYQRLPASQFINIFSAFKSVSIRIENLNLDVL
jgi:hypothetical protein